MTSAIVNRLDRDADLTERAMAEYTAREDRELATLLSSERYSLFAGGKRIRPHLVLAFCRLFGGTEEAALPFACAVEMIHTYSLIHDDLPCMDDDDLRRGKPTNHKVYGYATALLAGDSLLTRSFGVAASNPYVNAECARAAVMALSDAAGAFGMIGGQIMDLAGETEEMAEDKLCRLHARKTGALISLSARLGCLAAGVEEDSEEMRVAIAYAERIGLAFQIVDDVLDGVGDEKTLGKSASDAKRNKTTFLSFYSAEQAKAYAAELTAQAVSCLAEYEGSEELTDLAVYLLGRDH